MASPVRKRANYDDLLRVPDHLVAEAGRWVVAATHGGDEPVRAEPFDVIERDLGALWGGRPTASP